MGGLDVAVHTPRIGESHYCEAGLCFYHQVPTEFLTVVEAFAALLVNTAFLGYALVTCTDLTLLGIQILVENEKG
jgi:hypothetical protein